MALPDRPRGAPSTRPLFGGYVLLACVVAWLVGIALRDVVPLRPVPTEAWLLGAALAGAWSLGAALLRRRGGPSTPLALGVLALALLLGGARAASADTTMDPRSVARFATGAEVRLRGDVAAEPDLRDGYRYVSIEVREVSTDGGRHWERAVGRVQAAATGPDDWYAPAYGDAVSATGLLLARDGTTYLPPPAVARLRGARVLVDARSGGNPLLALLYELRLRLAQGIQRTLPEPEAALLIGILLGLKTPMLRARLPLFTATGTIHLVVPAGLKVAVLAQLAGNALRPLGPRPRIVGALGAVGLYAGLGGGGPAALRAAIMGGLLVLAPALGRTYNIFTSLAFAVLVMTALDPLLLTDAGFQLTTLATLGLPLFVPPVQRVLLACTGPLRRHGITFVLTEMLAVTLAAQLATLPVLALTFHEISLVAPLANLLTVPLLTVLLVLGVALAVAGALGGGVTLLAAALSWLVWPLLWYSNAVIAGSAALPLAAFAVPSAAVGLAWLYYLGLAGATWGVPALRRVARREAGQPEPPPRRRTHHRTAHGQPGAALLAGILVVALLGASAASLGALNARSTARLEFLDLGAGGQGTFLRLDGGTTVLLDGGPSGPALSSALGSRLPFWQRTLDLAVLTDPRPGALRGLEDAAAHYTIARAVDAGMRHPSADYLAWRAALDQQGARHTLVRQGNRLDLDATAALEVLAPPPQLYPASGGATTASNALILRLTLPGTRVLLLGAADAYALDALVGSGQSLAAEVVQVAVPRDVPLDLDGPLGDVLAAAHPRLVVVVEAPVAPTSATAVRARAQTPATSDAEVGAALGTLVLRTSQRGTVGLVGSGGRWVLA